MNRGRKTEFDKLLDQIDSRVGGLPGYRQVAHPAKIHGLIGEEQVAAAEKLESMLSLSFGWLGPLSP